MDIRADELPISACAVNSCPVPDKSTRCQSVRPVRMSWPSVWFEVSGGGDSDQPVTTFYTSVPSARVPQRDFVMAIRLGRVKWHEVLSNTLLDRPRTTIGALIVRHSIRPGQVRAVVAGRLIWHGTTVGGWAEAERALGHRHPAGNPVRTVQVGERASSVRRLARGDRGAAAYDRSRTHWLSREPGVLSQATGWMDRRRACGGACPASSRST
jgi:hypothetical protein